MSALAPFKLVIHRGSHNAGHYVWSPFVTKTEVRLRFEGVSYLCGTRPAFAGPKGKIPWVELVIGPQESCEILADSSLIVRNLISKGLLNDANAPLSARDRAVDLAVRTMLEEKLYFINARERWINDFYTMRDYTMRDIPLPQRILFGYLTYRNMVKKLDLQGLGRFSDGEVRSFRREIWQGINALLQNVRTGATNDACFWVLGGSEPTEADATVFGFIVSALVARAGIESKQFVISECPDAVEYARRIHHHYFSDYAIWS